MSHDPQADSRARLTQLWLESEAAVRAFVFAAVHSLHDADDVVQQVAMTVARRFDEYDPQRPFIGWVLWLAKSRIIDHYRQQGRQRVVFSDALLEQLAAVIADQPPQESSARRLALDECLDQLPTRSRQLLDLKYVDNLSIDALAKQTGITAGSARVMLCRIRDRLAECVDARLKLEPRGT